MPAGRGPVLPEHATAQGGIIRQPLYAHIDDLFGPFPARMAHPAGPGAADFPRWVLPFLAAQLADEAVNSPETITLDLLSDGRVVERAEDGYEDREIPPNPDGTYTVGPDWWWYPADARSALRSHVRAAIRPGTRYRRYRALIAAHAAATMLADGITTARDRLKSRMTER